MGDQSLPKTPLFKKVTPPGPPLSCAALRGQCEPWLIRYSSSASCSSRWNWDLLASAATLRDGTNPLERRPPRGSSRRRCLGETLPRTPLRPGAAPPTVPSWRRNWPTSCPRTWPLTSPPGTPGSSNEPTAPAAMSWRACRGSHQPWPAPIPLCKGRWTR